MVVARELLFQEGHQVTKFQCASVSSKLQCMVVACAILQFVAMLQFKLDAFFVWR